MAKYQVMFRPASRKQRRRAALGGALTAAVATGLVVAGCVTQPAAPGKAKAPRTLVTEVRTPPRQGAAAAGRDFGGDNTRQAVARGRGVGVVGVGQAPAAETDDCAARLHDISGLLLLFYATHRALPERLEELAPLADAGTPANFTCPVSGRPYVYVPGGLLAPGTKQRYLILYDATPAHDGIHWGITAEPPAPGQPLAMWITPLSGQVLQAYLASATDVPPPAAQGVQQQPQQVPQPQ